jgi:hypothetical protein
MRKVFFSFHYTRDVFRVSQVRNSWIVRGEKEAQPFLDKAEWEKKKATKGAIEKWIEDQLHGTSVTVILFGAETHARPWVIHEIKRSHVLNKGIVAVDIHRLKCLKAGADIQGINPLSTLQVGGRNLDKIYSSYDYVRDDGFNNMSKWIEAAARSVGR